MSRSRQSRISLHDEPSEQALVCIECNATYPLGTRNCPKDGGLVVPPKQTKSAESLVGTVFADRYQILSLIGEGGSGVVYKAQQLMIDRIVAIKILKTFQTQQKMLKRFQQEAHAASGFQHPNLISVHDFGISLDGEAYMVMAFTEGKSLESLIQAHGPMSTHRAGRIFVQVCDGLEHAHAKGIIHRDIKPSNILLMDHANIVDFVKILDFGIAQMMPESQEDALRLTQTGHVVGSPHFMSPEQCTHRNVDPRSDIYSVGVALYMTLTGQFPFDGATFPEIVYQHLKEQPKPPSSIKASIMAPWDTLVLRCLRKDPEDRFQTVAELRTALEVCLGKRQAPSPAQITIIKEEIDDSEAILKKLFDSLCTLSQSVSSGNQNLDHSDFLEKLANEHLNRRQFDEAEALFLGAIALTEKTRGKNSPEAATMLMKLGDLYLYRKKYAAAEQFYLRALEIKFVLVGQEHLEVADCLDKLGLLFLITRSYQQSEKFYSWALKLRQKLCAPREEILAISFDNVALACHKLGRLDDAIHNERRATAIREERFGETSIGKSI